MGNFYLDLWYFDLKYFTWRSVKLQWKFVYFSVTSPTFSWITSFTVTYPMICDITMKVCVFLCDLLPNFLLNYLTHCDLHEDLWYCKKVLCISLRPPRLSPESLHSLWPTWRSVISQWRFVYFSVTFSQTFSWITSLTVTYLEVCDKAMKVCVFLCDLLQNFSWITSLTVTYLEICDIAMKVCVFLCDLLPNFLLNHLIITHCDLPEDLWYCNEGLCISLWPSPKLTPESLHSLWPTWRSVILQWRFVYFSVTFSQTYSWIPSLTVTYLKICDIAMKVCVFLCDLPNFLLNHFTHCGLPKDLWYCNEGLCISLWTSPKLSPKSLHSLWPTLRSVIL